MFVRFDVLLALLAVMVLAACTSPSSVSEPSESGFQVVVSPLPFDCLRGEYAFTVDIDNSHGDVPVVLTYGEVELDGHTIDGQVVHLTMPLEETGTTVSAFESLSLRPQYAYVPATESLEVVGKHTLRVDLTTHHDSFTQTIRYGVHHDASC